MKLVNAVLRYRIPLKDETICLLLLGFFFLLFIVYGVVMVKVIEHYLTSSEPFTKRDAVFVGGGLYLHKRIYPFLKGKVIAKK
jgi:hypothetical protein